MSNKTCSECRYFLHKDTFEVCTHSMTETSMFDKACEHFAPPTNGDKIRQGGNIELFIYWQKNKCSVCAFNEKKTCSQLSCWDGMMEWLNAPAESEGEDE